MKKWLLKKMWAFWAKEYTTATQKANYAKEHMSVLEKGIEAEKLIEGIRHE